jgi:UDP:flavonoid glycosyltransferase YjiC (YdhE family)
MGGACCLPCNAGAQSSGSIYDRAVRVLFTCVAAEGHFAPLLPLARAFRDRGDAVAFATGPSFGRRIESHGFTPLAAGIDQPELEARFTQARAEIKTLPVPERRPHAFTRRFAQLDSPARADELRARAGEWQPDLIVHESAELAGPLVAAARGIPSVHHSFGRMIPRSAIDRGAPVAAAMWERAGLEPEPFAGMFRGQYVDLAPPSLGSEQPPDGTPVLPLRPAERAYGQKTDRPLIYVTLGTVFTGASVFRLLLSALADVDADVLVTTGSQHDPAELGPVPVNATVERYVPQAKVLPRAALVVTHGGSGSMLGALAHGLPLLVVPQQADQFDNAAAAARAGAALVLMPDALAEAAVQEATAVLLADGSHRRAAQAVADEIAAMPSADEVAERIERGVRARP